MRLKKTEGRTDSIDCRSGSFRRPQRWKFLVMPFIVLSVVVLLLAASGHQSVSKAESTKGKIVLVEMNWISQVINTKVAEILLREEMGYDVEPQLIDYVMGFISIGRGDADVRALWNKPVRLIFHLHQASLFAFRFAASGDGR